MQGIVNQYQGGQQPCPHFLSPVIWFGLPSHKLEFKYIILMSSEGDLDTVIIHSFLIATWVVDMLDDAHKYTGLTAKNTGHRKPDNLLTQQWLSVEFWSERAQVPLVCGSWCAGLNVNIRKQQSRTQILDLWVTWVGSAPQGCLWLILSWPVGVTWLFYWRWWFHDCSLVDGSNQQVQMGQFAFPLGIMWESKLQGLDWECWLSCYRTGCGSRNCDSHCWTLTMQ